MFFFPPQMKAYYLYCSAPCCFYLQVYPKYPSISIHQGLSHLIAREDFIVWMAHVSVSFCWVTNHHKIAAAYRTKHFFLSHASVGGLVLLCFWLQVDKPAEVVLLHMEGQSILGYVFLMAMTDAQVHFKPRLTSYLLICHWPNQFIWPNP